MLRKCIFTVLIATFSLVLPAVIHASADKADRINAGEATPGATVLQRPVARAKPLRILVAHPVVHGLAAQLLRGVNGMELARVVPGRLPANRLPAYLVGRGQDALMAAAAQAHAVLTLRSIWPDDQLYPLARRANIHIVEIDVANPVEGDLPGVTLPGGGTGDMSVASMLSNPPWQDSANLSRMAAIMANALSRLVPEAAPRLHTNLADVNQRLQRAEAHTSRALAEADDLSVLLLSPRMHMLAMALQLEPVSWQAPENDTDLPAALSRALIQGKPRVVLTHVMPDEASAKLIQESGVKLVVLSESAKDPVAALVEAMQAIGEAMRGR